MRIIRYEDAGGAACYGAEGADGEVLKIDGDILSEFHVTAKLADARRRLAPIKPSALICIGLNYRAHAKETGAQEPESPVVFLKSPTALQNPDDPIELPRTQRSDKVDYEGELAVVIGKTCKNVAREDALSVVLGYTIANDVSARDWQRERDGGQFSHAKSFDTFAPLGPCIVTADEILDPQSLRIVTTINGETLQDSSAADMIFDVGTLIAFLSGSTTLAAGTVILTGTPHGVGMGRTPPRWLNSGDHVSITINPIGTLSNPIIEEKTF